MYNIEEDPLETVDLASELPVLLEELKYNMLEKYRSVEKDRLAIERWIGGGVRDDAPAFHKGNSG